MTVIIRVWRLLADGDGAKKARRVVGFEMAVASV
jgi:hypothetical protein